MISAHAYIIFIRVSVYIELHVWQACAYSYYARQHSEMRHRLGVRTLSFGARVFDPGT